MARASRLRSGEPYAVVLAPSAHRLYKKFDSALQNRIKQEAQKVARSPYTAPPLHSPFEDLRSHHFQFRNAQYRIAYRIREERRGMIDELSRTLGQFGVLRQELFQVLADKRGED